MALNYEKSTVSHPSVGADPRQCNGHPTPTGCHTEPGRAVVKESALKPLNSSSSSSNLDSSVQMLIEKMHSGLEVSVLYLFFNVACHGFI